MDQRNGSTPHPVVSQSLFDRLNRLAEQFAEAADMAILHLRGEIPLNSPIYTPYSVADDLDQLCEALDQFRAANSIAVPDLKHDPDHHDSAEEPLHTTSASCNLPKSFWPTARPS